jgi:hypothetical protein
LSVRRNLTGQRFNPTNQQKPLCGGSGFGVECLRLDGAASCCLKQTHAVADREISDGRMGVAMNTQMRLKLGIALLVLGLVMPFGTVFVTRTDWPVAVKTVASGILLLSFEIMVFPAIALMGKENFNRIIAWAKSILKMLRPTGCVGRTRYAIGLVLLVGPVLFGWVASYVPPRLFVENSVRVWTNLGLDLMVASSLFVLGGDFWDKLRALFRYDAKAMFPARENQLSRTASS